jgi:hypothetical protein
VAIYAITWLTGTALVVGAVLVLSSRHTPATVSVPPLSETRLSVAAHKAGCRLLGARVAAAADCRSRAQRRRERRPRASMSGRSPGSRCSPLHRGTIVVEFGRVPDAALSVLKAAQSLVPSGTILAPGAGLRYAVVALAYRHVPALLRAGGGRTAALPGPLRGRRTGGRVRRSPARGGKPYAR